MMPSVATQQTAEYAQVATEDAQSTSSAVRGDFSVKLAQFRESYQSKSVETTTSDPPLESNSKPRHPSCFRVLNREKGLLGESNSICLAEPLDTQICSNPPKVSYVFINGLNADTNTLGAHLKLITAITGQSVTTVINDQREFVYSEYLSAGLGILSARIGARRERPEVDNLIAEIRENLKSGKKTVLLGYSHGTIILSNALVALKRESTPGEWQAITKNVEVLALGCAMREWPIDLNVRIFNHEHDSVEQMSAPFWNIRKAFLTLFCRKPQIPEITRVPSRNRSIGHNLHEYVRNFPRFLIAAHTDATGKLDSKGLANELISSIREGRYSDRISRAVIRNRIAKADHEFLQTFQTAFENGQIEAYKVPFMPRISALAKRGSASL